MADKIKSFLGFSEPEDGPLSDFHTYMPDMIDLMTQRIYPYRHPLCQIANSTLHLILASLDALGHQVNHVRHISMPQGGGAIRVSDVLDVAVKGLASGVGKAKAFLDSAMGEGLTTLALAMVFISPMAESRNAFALPTPDASPFTATAGRWALHSG